MSLSHKELLFHIKDEVDYLMNNSLDLEFDDFVSNDTLVRAYARSLEIIGEATKKLPKKFKDEHPEIEWKGMAGMRDKLIHDYFGVDYELVWDIIENKIPELKKHLERLL